MILKYSNFFSENNKITIYNNGKGIPVVEHKVEKMFVPTLIFGHLLTSSNYNDAEKKVVGGRNGYGAKLCNVFSTKFTVETSCKEYKKRFKQTWKNNMHNSGQPIIEAANGEDFTRITFYPDLAKFKMEKLDKDIVDLLSRRAYDVAGSSKGVKVFLNGQRLPVRGFKEYVQQYLKDKEDDMGQPLKISHEEVNARWEIAVTVSDRGFQQVSFVNSIATTKGGRHVDYVVEQVIQKLTEVIKKKNKAGINVKPFQLKSHLWVFVNCLIENPTFDSQTKENMTLQSKAFGSKCEPSEKFFQTAMKMGVVESVMTWIKFKADTDLAKSCHSKKHAKLKGIPKLEDANDAGTKNSSDCTLILTEGDSAKSLVIAGFAVIGRDKYGVFPLKGKLLNVREASHKQIMENAEITNIVKIMGLQYKKKYETLEDLKSLRYGKLMIMTDQDQDGSHIKGLLINFIHHNWPTLLKLPFLEEFITPIVKATKGNVSKSFYSLPEFEEWKQQTDNWTTYKIKYYKGLGTSTPQEAKEYFSEIRRHRICFKYQGAEDDHAVMLAFSKKMIEQRKDWLTTGMEERKRRKELGLPELYLYEKETRNVTLKDFINKELILFSNMDNERSIPSIMDGLKPGQRKVIYTCLKRNDKREVKVAQLAGSVGEHSAYHHGEASLMSTIINLAQNYVGSNNINLLQPIGQFGTRLQGGKDAASPRYIFTMLSPLTRKLFSIQDDPLLNYLNDDNTKIEPDYYVPVIPMVLVNGAEGIGTGWSTKIPNYNPREIIQNLRRMIEGLDPLPMKPWFKGFRGSVVQVDSQKFVVNGELAVLNEKSFEITELPVKTWTQTYKESVLEAMVHGGEKNQESFITDYKEYHTDTTIRFLVLLNEENLQKAEKIGIHKHFKLQTTMSLSSMVLFDHNGCLKRYENPEEILNEFYNVRLDFYKKRKAYFEGMLEAEAKKLQNQARFILEKNNKTLIMENIKKKEFVGILISRKFDSDPVKLWKKQAGFATEEKADEEDEENEQQLEKKEEKYDFDYLLDMNMRSMLREKVDELLKKRDGKLDELEKLRKATPQDLWKEDLDVLLEELDKVEQLEKENEGKTLKSGKTKKIGFLSRKTGDEAQPSSDGRRIEPHVDMDFYKSKTEKSSKGRATKAKSKLDLLKAQDNEKDEDEIPKRNQESNLGENRTKKLTAGKKLKQTTLNFRPMSKQAAKNKRDPWSDDSEDEDETFISDSSEEEEDFAPLVKKQKAEKRKEEKENILKEKQEQKEKKAAKKANKEKGEKQMKDDLVNFSQTEDDIAEVPDSPKFSPKPKKQAKKPKPAVSGSESDEPKVKKQKKTAARKVISSESESDIDIPLKDRLEARQLPQRSRPAAKYVFSETDED